MSKNTKNKKAKIKIFKNENGFYYSNISSGTNIKPLGFFSEQSREEAIIQAFNYIYSFKKTILK